MILPPALAELPPPHYVCIQQAAQMYTVPVLGLLAIWAVEGGRVGKVSQNKDGSFDHGNFQINSFWTNKFAQWFGVSAQQVRDDFCMNARAAAYVLRYEINQAKGDFWEGIGRYHAPNNPSKARAYRLRVKQAADGIFLRETGYVHP